MVQYHKNAKSKRSGTGGKKRTLKDKVLAHYGGFFKRTRVDAQDKRENIKTKGGNRKTVLLRASFANVSTKNGVKKAKILSVVSNDANRHFTREGVVTKGAVLQTELGKARVTSRPSQTGVVNAVLIEEKK